MRNNDDVVGKLNYVFVHSIKLLLLITSPLFLQESAKSAFSDRNPKPGWIASQCESCAISMIFLSFR